MFTRRLSLLLLLAVLGSLSFAQAPVVYPNTTLTTPDAAPSDGQEDVNALPTNTRSTPRRVPLPSAETIPDTRMSPSYPPFPLPRMPANEPASEFQEFVKASLGRSLPLFGYNLFSDVPTTFAPVDRVPVTPDYVIAPGDELLIRAWGQIDLDARVVVDRTGAIYLPKVGTLTVTGLRFAELQDYLKSSVGKVFRNFDLTVSLGQLRSIQVFVVGQARRPGTYTVSSMSTLVNALFASGGPSANGSLRHIQLKRGKQLVTEFDVYDLLLNGDKSKDVQLLPGDIIFIPPVGPRVALAGSVNLAGIYELKGDCTLWNALNMAGGLTSVADGLRVRVERIENRSTRKVEEMPLAGAGSTGQLQDGDLVYVIPLSPKFENAVTLRGNVAVPGRYPWHTGMRVSDLIPTREALTTREYWLRQNLSAGTLNVEGGGWKSKTARIDGVANDTIDDGQQSTNNDQPQSTNSDRQQSRDSKLSGSQLRTEIRTGTAEINWSYAALERMDKRDLSTNLIPFNLGNAILGGDTDDNVELQAGDVITIFSRADLKVPVRQQTEYVYLDGELTMAGVYKAKPGETLRQLLNRAGGGLTPQAYLFGAVFTRESTREKQRKLLDEVIQRMEHELDLVAVSSAGKASTPEESAAAKAKLDEQRAQIEKLKQLQPDGRIVLQLPPGAKDLKSVPDMILEDGDHLYVPYRTSEVNVVGEVSNANSFIYDPHKHAGDYLRLAGPTRFADRRYMFLLRADGSIVPRNGGSIWGGDGFEKLRLMPGDSIVVPPNTTSGSMMKELKDWTQIFAQLALGAAAIRVIGP